MPDRATVGSFAAPVLHAAERLGLVGASRLLTADDPFRCAVFKDAVLGAWSS